MTKDQKIKTFLAFAFLLIGVHNIIQSFSFTIHALEVICFYSGIFSLLFGLTLIGSLVTKGRV